MRNVILYMSMSLDGFLASDREHPGIAIPEGVELKQWKLDGMSKAGAHLMGRTTYQEMSSYRPQSEDPYAAPMNDIRKVVFSKKRRRRHPAGDPCRSRRSGDRDLDHETRARLGRHRVGRRTIGRRAGRSRPD